MYFLLCLAVFLAAYILNVLTVTVGYHRALAHGSVRLSPLMRKLVVNLGNWLTGLDPKAWVVMHRLHHQHSDTAQDPHSPANVGVLGIGLEQLRNYKKVIVGLAREKPEFTRYATDLDFPLSAMNLKRLWFVPYLLQAVIALTLGATIGWLLGAAWFLGMMSHPIQGGMVNSFGHAIGGRNFETRDNSRNNHLVAWLVFGEGFQNNHHQYPASAKFSTRWYEFDLGYWCCVAFEKMGLLTISRASLIPKT